jgi:hypothetical protein
VTTRDDDILDFDFFDEEEEPTWEEPEPAEPGPRPGGRGPRGGRPRFRPPGNLTPLLRLVALIALAILIVVLLAVWIEGCASDRKRDRYADYMAEVGTVGAASANLGEQVATLLTTVGLSQEDLDAKLGGYVQTAENQLQRADALRPPGPLHDADEGALEALLLRVNGLQGLRRVFQRTADATDATEVGLRLAAQSQRLLASDVVWADLFRAPGQAVVAEEGVEGVNVPSSDFVTDDDLYTARSMAAVWQRIQGVSTGGTPTGSHGSELAYVKALPSGQLLATTTETSIPITTELAFEVGVTDSGDSPEVRIKVTLTIPRSGQDPIVRRGTIAVIDPGETKAVTLKIGTLVPFEEQTTVKVDIDPVPGETYTTNNTAEYPVIFAL